MNSIPKWLSKTKLLRGYRCHKCIYLTIHQPKLEAPITPETQALFDQGNKVGKEAQKVFPGGTLISNLPWDFSGAIAATREAVAALTPVIYEAAFEYKGCYARADIIQHVPESKRWRIIEVKSTTKVKPEHLDDVGLQTWIMAKSGLLIEQISIMHLNSDCRYPDLSNLFKIQDVTAEMRENYLTVQPTVAEIFKVLQQPTVPTIDIGPYCTAPNACGFKEHCWKEKNIPPVSVFNLPGLRDTVWDLYKDGIIALDDARLTNLNPLQERIVHAFKTNERYVDRPRIQEAISQWQFPLIFLDFETINPAIPQYDGCGPFMQVPFQFSVHIWRDKNSELEHIDFLHDNTEDPRPALIPALLAACEKKGSVVAYYGIFESTRIQELATYSPAHHAELTALAERIVDPLPILRECVYDNAFAGSFSLKNVGPALLGSAFSYKDMLVANGGDAQRAYLELISPTIPPARKKNIKEAMIEYCKKDTLVMVELVKWLYHGWGSSRCLRYKK